MCHRCPAGDYGHYSMYASYWNHVGTKVGQGVQQYSNVESLYIKYLHIMMGSPRGVGHNA